MNKRTLPKRSGLPRYALIVGLVILLALGFWTGSALRQTAPPVDERLLSGTMIPTPRPLTAFSLTDHNGQPFLRETLNGEWHLLSFGYTHCPDVCPTTLALLARINDRLHQEAPDVEIQTVFVTIDPQRDTQAVLASYVPYFNRKFLGITGSPQEIERLTSQLGVAFARVEPEGGPYLMDHTVSLILINPQGEFQAVFSAPHQEKALAHDLQTLIRQHP